MARYWLHNGLLQAADEVGKLGGRATRSAAADIDSQIANKVSKSKGSAPFRELLQEFSPETIRFFLLATHYRRPVEYSHDRLRETAAALENFYRFFKRYQRVTGEDFYTIVPPLRRAQGDFEPGDDSLLKDVVQHRNRFLDAMDDDFNTGGAMGDVFELLRRLNKYIDDEKLETKEAQTPARLTALRRGVTVFRELGNVMGLFRQPPPEKSPEGNNELTGKLMGLLIELRAESRKKKDFATADLIRKRLGEIGVVLEDRPGGTEWSVTQRMKDVG
jgi:cysteinyl-tRNA synthetase